MNILPPVRLTAATEPDLRGALGSAWRIDMDMVSRRRGMPDDPRRTVSLPTWVVSAAYAHPAWSHYCVLGMALREAPGVQKAKINLDGATHEVMVFAMNPHHAPAVDDFPNFLSPCNFAGQFVEESDEAAAARIEQAVQDVIDGKLNPDTDFRAQWVQRFSGSNLKRDLLPDFIAATPDARLVVVGTGAQNTRNLQTIVQTQATMQADESKPQ